MRADEVLTEMKTRRGLSNRKASELTGRSPGYFSRMISKNVIPGTSVLADIADKLKFDLILRDREDGTEMRIDPPRD